MKTEIKEIVMLIYQMASGMMKMFLTTVLLFVINIEGNPSILVNRFILVVSLIWIFVPFFLEIFKQKGEGK